MGSEMCIRDRENEKKTGTITCTPNYNFTMNAEVFFIQAEDGIQGAQESRGLGDVYKRQVQIR